VRFLSCEPLLGAVDLGRIVSLQFKGAEYVSPLDGRAFGMFGEPAGSVPKIDWVIAGGESGPGARPMHPDWVRSLRDQCAAGGVPFFFKQWGEWLPACQRQVVDAPTPGECTFISPDGFRCTDGIAGRATVGRVGKRAAGRLLDGVQHDGMPA
jgi:protein gp37